MNLRHILILSVIAAMTMISSAEEKSTTMTVAPNPGSIYLDMNVALKKYNDDASSLMKFMDIILLKHSQVNDTLRLSQGSTYEAMDPIPYIKAENLSNNSSSITQSSKLLYNAFEISLAGSRQDGFELSVSGFPPLLRFVFDNSITAIKIINYSKATSNVTTLISTPGTHPLTDIATLNSRLEKSKSNITGLYTYLDRENDPDRARPGGFYKLAVVESENAANTFEIIYISGAEVNPSAWETGMIKGELTETQFINHFDLKWYDSEHETLDNECFATLTQNAILELSFPLYKTKMRFTRLDGSLQETKLQDLSH